MATTGAKARLHNYLRKVYLFNPEAWLHKGDLEKVGADSGYLIDQLMRRMRELVEEGKVQRRSVGNSQEYRYIPHWDEWIEHNK